MYTLEGATLGVADLIALHMLMPLERAVARDEEKPMGTDLHPFDTYFPSIAAWRGRIEALPGFRNAYPPHWAQA